MNRQAYSVVKPPFKWEELHTMTMSQLLTLGFATWNRDELTQTALMLIHRKWHKSIPANFELETISGEKVICNPKAKPGEKGYVDGDHRGGYLAYGIRVPIA